MLVKWAQVHAINGAVPLLSWWDAPEVATIVISDTLLQVTMRTSMVGHPCHNYGLISRFEVCNALCMWGYALCNSRNA